MRVNELIDRIVELTQLNPLAALSAAFIALVLLFWRPKIFFILLALGMAAIGIMHLFARLAETGL